LYLLIFCRPSFIDLDKKKNHLTSSDNPKKKIKEVETMNTLSTEKETSMMPLLISKLLFSIGFEYYIFNLDGSMILTNLLSIMLCFFYLFVYSNNTFKYLFIFSTFFLLDTFHSSSRLLNTFNGHSDCVYNIDYSTFSDSQFICSGSKDKTVCVWDIDNKKQIQSFNGHSCAVGCVKFSPYHYHNYRSNVICSSSADKTIRFWDCDNYKQLQLFNEHTSCICGIELSPFNGGRYLCSGSRDKTIRLWDIETSKSLHVFNGHEKTVWCIDISPLQSNNNNNDNKSNNIGVIGGNGYTICSGSFDNTIRIWDIETTKQLILFKGHKYWIRSVKYGPNELGNTILSGSSDHSVRLWDIRSGQQIQVFNGHTSYVLSVEYSPFVVNNIKIGGNSNVICSGSRDNTIRFWDIRSNKDQLYSIKGGDEDNGITCFKFLYLKINRKYNLCYGSLNGLIHIWG
ncbi:WD-40 repeat protein, partial [Reticulomyxa filosa]